MSRIGRAPISIPSGVTVEVSPAAVMVRGPKGQLSIALPSGISVQQADQVVTVKRADDLKQSRANHGLVRSLLANAVLGVTTGFKKTLKLVGTGYRATSKGAGISLTLGFSHPVEYQAPAGVTLKVEGNDTITIEGFDKQAVGQTAAVIRAFRKPEPYKGKGIRYENEIVRRKQGKAAAK